MKRRIIYEIFEILETLFSIFPGTLGKYVRRGFYKLFLKKCGKEFYAALRVKLQNPANIEIGNNVGLNYGVWIASNSSENAKIIIGDNVLIGPYSVVHSGNHVFQDVNIPITKQGFQFKKITIEDDVWIAARCTILSGVTIGKGSVIAAGAVVTKDIPPFSIVAGIPGKIISKRT